METAENIMESTIVFWGNIGILENRGGFIGNNGKYNGNCRDYRDYIWVI